jgi:WD40 repeat protein
LEGFAVAETLRVDPHVSRDNDNFFLMSNFNGQKLGVLQGIRDQTYDFAHTSDGSHLLLVDATRSRLEEYDGKGQLRWKFDDVNRQLTGCVLSQDGSLAVGIYTRAGLILLNGSTGQLLRQIAFSQEDGRPVLSHRAKQVAWTDDNDIHIRDLFSNRAPVTMIGHSAQVLSASFSPDDSRILSCSVDGTARLWDAQTGRELLKLGSGQSAVLSAEFDREGRRIFTTDSSGNFTSYPCGYREK